MARVSGERRDAREDFSDAPRTYSGDYEWMEPSSLSRSRPQRLLEYLIDKYLEGKGLPRGPYAKPVSIRIEQLFGLDDSMAYIGFKIPNTTGLDLFMWYNCEEQFKHSKDTDRIDGIIALSIIDKWLTHQPPIFDPDTCYGDFENVKVEFRPLAVMEILIRICDYWLNTCFGTEEKLNRWDMLGKIDLIVSLARRYKRDTEWDQLSRIARESLVSKTIGLYAGVTEENIRDLQMKSEKGRITILDAGTTEKELRDAVETRAYAKRQIPELERELGEFEPWIRKQLL